MQKSCRRRSRASGTVHIQHDLCNFNHGMDAGTKREFHTQVSRGYTKQCNKHQLSRTSVGVNAVLICRRLV